MQPAQLDIFGGTKAAPQLQRVVGVIMDANAKAQEEHGVLMWEYARYSGMTWIDDLPVGMKSDLMKLLKVSPHVERASRKWREDDARKKKGV